MPHRPSTAVLLPCFAWLLAAPGWGQESASQALVAQEKAGQYHQVLLKRPNAGAIFDRFYDAWLDHGTVETLQTFLTEQCTKKNLAADHLLLAFFHLKHGKQVEALISLRAAVKADPENATAWFYKAEVESGTLAFDEAMASLQKIPADLADSDLARRAATLRGRLLLRLDKRDEAIACWRAVAKKNPSDQDLADEIVDLLVAEGLVEAAISDSATLCARTTDPFAKVRRELRRADLIASAGRRAEAVSILDTLVDSVAAASWLERETIAAIERLYRREDDLSGLTKHLSELSTKMPTRTSLARRLIFLHEQAGQHDEAIALSKSLMDRSPGDRRAGEDHAALLVKAGKSADALAVLSALRTAHPKDQDLIARHAEALHQAGKDPEAILAVKDFTTLIGETPSGSLRAARLAQRCGLSALAESLLSESLAKNPEALDLREELGSLLFAGKKSSEAVQLLSATATTANVATLLRLSRTLAANKELAAAESLLSLRQKDFGTEESYLQERSRLLIQKQDFVSALPITRQLLDLANGPTALALAIDQIILCADKAQKRAELAAEIQAVEKPTVRQRCLAACLAERSGDKLKADEMLANSTVADDPLIQATQIRLFRGRQDFAAAAALVERRLTLSGGKTLTNLRDAVELHQRAGAFDKALALIPEWKKAAPGSVEAILTEVSLLQNLGRNDEGISVLRRAAAKIDDPRELQERLASLYETSGRFLEAERLRWRIYDDAQSLDDKLAQIRQLAFQSQWRDGAKTIITRLEERRASNRQSIVPLLSLAAVYQSWNESAKRRAMLLEASRIQGDNLNVLWELSQVAQEDGDHAEALAVLERALPLDTVDQGRSTLGRMARLHFARGDSDAGYAVLERLMGSQDAKSVEAMADLMLSQKDYARAITYLTPMVQRHPKDYRLRGLLAVAFEEDGRLDEAFEHYLAMLGMNEEIVRPGPAKHKIRHHGYDEYFSKMPNEVKTIFRLLQFSYEVYSYRQRNQYHHYSMQGFVPTGTIPLAESLEELPLWSLTHLAQVSQGLGLSDTDPRRQRRSQALSLAGLSVVDVLLDSPFNYENLASILLEKKPNDPIALAVALSNSWNGLPQLSLEQGNSAIKAFKTSHPIYAVLGALAAGTNTSDPGMLQQANDLLQGITAYDDTSAMMLFSLMQNRQGTPVSATFSSVMMKKLRSWYPEIQKKNSGYGNWMFVSMASALAKENDPKAWLGFLEEHLQNSQSKQVQMSHHWYGGGRDETFLSAISFPPQSGIGIPPEILAAFKIGENNDGSEAVLPEPEVILSLIPQAKSPVLRILLALAAQAEDKVDEELTLAMKNLSPTQDILLLAAGRRAAKEDHAGASQALVMARFLPLDAQLRQMIDGALVAAARNGKDETARKAGREAALRLRQQTLQKEQRELLLAAMQDLGMSKEAKQLEETAQTPGLFSGIASLFGGGSTPRHSSPQTVNSLVPAKVSQLLLDDKKDEALTALVASLKPAAIQAMDFQSNLDDEHLKALNDLVTANAFTQDLITRLTPAKDAPAREHAILGRVLEFLDKDAEAEKAYQEALAKRPDEPFVVLRLIQLCWDRESKDMSTQLAALVAKVPKTQQSQLQHMLQQAVYEETQNPSKVFALTETVIAVLSTMPDFLRQDLSWTTSVFDALGQEKHVSDPNEKKNSSGGSSTYYRRGRKVVQYYGGNQKTLKKLYSRIQNKTVLSDPLLIPVAKRQRELHDALCQILLKHPSQGPDAFSRLLLIAQAEKTVSATTVATAFEVLAQVPQATAFGHQYYGGHHYYSSSDDEEENQPPRLISPQEFVAAQAFKHHDRAWLDAQVTAKLNNSRLKERADAVKAFADLYFCPEDQFLVKCKEIIGKSGRQSMQNPEQKIQEIIAVYEDRKLSSDLGGLILEQIKNPQTAMMDPSLSIAQAWLKIVRKKGDVKPFITALGEILIGPKDQWTSLIAKHAKPGHNYSPPNTPAGKIQAFKNLLTSLIRQHPTSAIITILDDCFPTDRDWANNLSLPYNLFRDLPDETTAKNEEIAKRQERILKILKNSCFTAELPDFRGLRKTDGESVMGETILDRRDDQEFQVIMGLPEDSDNKVTDDTDLTVTVRANLMDRLPATFGTGVIRALLDKNPATAFLEHCGKYHQEIQALSPARQTDLGAILASARKKEAQPSPASPGAQAIWAIFNQANLQKTQQDVAALMGAKSFKDLKINEWQFDEYLGPIVGELLNTDPEKAAAALEKGLLLYAQRPNRHNSSNEDWLSNFFYRVPENSLKSKAGIALILKLSQRSVEPKLKSLPWQLGDGLQEQLRKHLGTGTDKASLFASFCADLDAIGPDPAGLWPLLFLQVVNREQMFSKDAGQVLEKVKTQTGPASQAGAMTLTLSTALSQAKAKTEHKHGKTSSSTRGIILAPEVFEPYLKVLPTMAENLQSAWFEAFFNLGRSDESIALPPALTQIYINNIKASRKGQRSIGDHHLQRFLSSYLLQEHDEAWKKNARDIVAHRLNSVNSNSFSSHADDDYERADLPTVLMNTALAAEDASLAMRIIQLQAHLGRRIGTYAALVQQGAYAEAKRLLHMNATTLRNNPQGQTWNEALAKTLPEFLAQVEIPAEKLLAEVLLSSLPDPQPLPPGCIARDQRLLPLIEKSAVSTGKPLIDLNILAALSSEPKLADRLEARLKPIVTDLDLSTIGTNADPLNAARRQVVLAYLKTQLAAGQTDLLLKTLAKFPEKSDSRSDDTEKWKETLLELPSEALKDQLAKGATITAAQIDLVLKTCLTAQNKYHDVAKILVLGVASGHGEKIQAWHQTLPKNDRQMMKKNANNCSIFATLGSLVHTVDGKPALLPTRREEIILSCLRHPAILSLLSSRNVFEHALGHEGLLPEELPELGARICTNSPRGTKIWNELIEEMNNKGMQNATCAIWTSALASASTPALRSEFTLNLLGSLRGAGRDEEAVKMAKACQTTDWTEQAKAKLVPFLSPAPQQVSAPKPATTPVIQKPTGIIP